MIKVFIDGQVGTTGLRIKERLLARRDVELITIPEELRKNAEAKKEYINSSDVTFLCLPDGVAKESVTIANQKVKIIDASTAHRTASGWAYGFPELGEDIYKNILSGNRIANPGCHASGFIALVYPLISSGVLAKDIKLDCTSITGYSGGGKGMISDYEADGREALLDAPRMYGLTQSHKHLPEMTHVTGLTKTPSFMPIVGDFYSGMEVIVPIELDNLKGVNGLNELKTLFKDFYQGKELVKAVEFEGNFISANALAGKDTMQVGVVGNDERAVLVALFDNLGKGASGAAIQNFNIITGSKETEGLVL
ncbi:MAG: N-acetyl-gamma-glutamyl-phosphate reductase [Clostridia bacterium]|nr:N-acetyl-gamma-glutamyl-phosphate reductase [Clostridia bacterium]